MRRVFGVFLMSALLAPALTAPAAADDFDILRGFQTVGPATVTRWSGFYFGGQIGYGDSTANFNGATGSAVAYSLRNSLVQQEYAPSQWSLLTGGEGTSLLFGGFAGYNTQWQDLVIGVEATYNHANFKLNAASTPEGHTLGPDSSGSLYTLNLQGTGSIQATDYGSLRLRAGYVLGSFLPYAYIGPAIGLASVATGVTGSGMEYFSGQIGTCTTAAPCVPLTVSGGTSVTNQFQLGFDAGFGIDFALTSNVFLRSEFEYVQFDPPPGIPLRILSGHIGAGLKF
jgi:opacity protein-like surface antigen